jgi:flagellar motility protein MotE (MotC chaperone)
MNRKIILITAISINLLFLGIYLSIHPLSAAEDSRPQTAEVREELPQDPGAQWESLRQREEAIAIRQQELETLEKQLDEKLRKLQELDAGIKAEVAAYRQISDERIKHLVKIYSSMKPNAAASLMNNLDTGVAVEVFLNMKGEIAGGILSYMDTTKAANITQRLMNYRGSGQPVSGQQ